MNTPKNNTFKNPVAPVGHDPFVIQKNGFYYYCYSHEGSIWINKHQKLQDAVQLNGKKIWTGSEEHVKTIAKLIKRSRSGKSLKRICLPPKK